MVVLEWVDFLACMWNSFLHTWFGREGKRKEVSGGMKNDASGRSAMGRYLFCAKRKEKKKREVKIEPAVGLYL